MPITFNRNTSQRHFKEIISRAILDVRSHLQTTVFDEVEIRTAWKTAPNLEMSLLLKHKTIAEWMPPQAPNIPRPPMPSSDIIQLLLSRKMLFMREQNQQHRRGTFSSQSHPMSQGKRRTQSTRAIEKSSSSDDEDEPLPSNCYTTRSQQYQMLSGPSAPQVFGPGFRQNLFSGASPFSQAFKDDVRNHSEKKR